LSNTVVVEWFRKAKLWGEERICVESEGSGAAAFPEEEGGDELKRSACADSPSIIASDKNVLL
jgi:hypothetical protein